jgi:hypothetical protein
VQRSRSCRRSKTCRRSFCLRSRSRCRFATAPRWPGESRANLCGGAWRTCGARTGGVRRPAGVAQRLSIDGACRSSAKVDSYALRHEQSELLLAAAGALRSPLRRLSGVAGVTEKPSHALRSARLSAASSARSAGSNRGRFACRRRIVSSWRKARISSSFDRSERATSTAKLEDAANSNVEERPEHRTSQGIAGGRLLSAYVAPAQPADRVCAPYGNPPSS